MLALLGLVGCPTGAELENEGRFKSLSSEVPVPSGCDEPLPDTALFNCDYPAALRTYCATAGCHGNLRAAGLDLRVDPQLIARVLEVPATHRGIPDCPGSVDCVASMRTCDRCDRCPENALLVDRDAPAESWILKKMEQFIPGTTTSNVNIGCGDTMPSFLSPAPVISFGDEDKRCLTEFFLHIATNTPNPSRWPCPIQPDGGT